MLYDLYDLAHVAGLDLYYSRSYTTFHNGRLGYTVDDLDNDLSDLSM